MKTALAILIVAAACSCTTTTVTTEHWSIRRTSFLQRIEIPEVSVGTNGMAVLRGYKSDGGNEALSAAVAAAVAAALKCTIP